MFEDITGRKIRLAVVGCGRISANHFASIKKYADDIEPEEIDEVAEETMGPYHMAGCYGCQVHCRAQYRIPSGPLKGKYDEGPEYTSQGAFCSETDTPNMKTLLVSNHLVDQNRRWSPEGL